ncbi:hypothetical protein BH11MYX3_BH11MYX3_10960 [soil metagenome]
MNWPALILTMFTGTAAAEPLTLSRGQLAVRGDVSIVATSRSSLGTTVHDTTPVMRAGGGFGILPWVTAGASYAFELDDPGRAGLLTVFGAAALVQGGRLSIGVGLETTLDLGSVGDGVVAAGGAVRYQLTPAVAVFTGSPWLPGPLGHQLQLGLGPTRYAVLDLPVGVEVAFTPRVIAHAGTGLASIVLSDPGLEDRVTTLVRRNPIDAGVWVHLDGGVSLIATLSSPDLRDHDYIEVGVGARYLR